ncbi:MAG: ABC transporter permease [Anaerolineales bacterium]
MEELVDFLFDVSLARGAIRLATPVVLAGLGTMLTSRAGILNIAVEGMILLGAFVALAGSYFSGSALVGVLLAMLLSMLLAYIFALFSLKWKAHIIIMGVAINIFAGFLTIYLLRSIFGVAGAFSDPSIQGIPVISLPVIRDIPVLGPLLSDFSLLVYVSWGVVILTHIFLYRTRWGIHLRAVGEAPDAAKTMGINVERFRYLAVVSSGALGGLAGAYLSLGHLILFTEGMSAGRGFIGLAASIFGMGTPLGTFAASMIFGLFDSIAWRLQGLQVLPVQFIQMLPYIATIAILIAIAVRTNISRARLARHSRASLKAAAEVQ